MKASQLENYRHRSGLSIRELSEMTGIPTATLNRIIKYPRNARGFQIAAICEALGMSWEEYKATI